MYKMPLATLHNLFKKYVSFVCKISCDCIDGLSCMYSVCISINYTAQFYFIMFLTFMFRRFKLVSVTAYLSGYTGRICLRLNLYFQHIKKLLQSKKGNINITMYK